MTVDASQLVLAERRQIRSLLLLSITTYTNRTDGTVDTVWRFSDLGVRFDLNDGSGAVDWLPFVVSVSDLRHEIPHLSGPDAGGNIFSRSLQIELRNHELDGGATLFQQLNAENIINARCRLYELLLPDPTAPITSAVLNGLTGDQTPLYSGIVRQVRDKGVDTFSLYLQTEAPSLDHDVINTTGADGRAIGVLANDVYGYVEYIPCHGYDIGGTAPLALALDDVGTTLTLTDTSLFAASGELMVGTERMTYSAKNDNDRTITVSARGYSSSTAVYHHAGELATEIRTDGAKFLVARHPMQSIDAVFVRSPLDGRLFYVPDDYTAYLSTTDGIPSGMAGPCAYVNFTSGDLRVLVERFYAQAEFGGVPSEETTEEEDATWDGIVTNSAPDTYPTYVDGPGDMTSCVPTLSVNTYTMQQLTLGASQGVAFQWSGLSGPTNPITSWRIRFDIAYVNVLDSGDKDLRVKVYANNISALGGPGGRTLLIEKTWDVGTYGPESLYSSWFTPPSGTDLSDFNNSSGGGTWDNIFVFIYIDNGQFTNGQYVKFNDTAAVIEAKWTTTATTESRDRDANSATRFQAGHGLEVFCTGGGYVAPDATYSVDEGVLLQSGEDITRHLIVARAGMSSTASVASAAEDIPAQMTSVITEAFDVVDIVTYSGTAGGGPTTYKHSLITDNENTASKDGSNVVTLQSHQSPSQQGAVYTFGSALNSDFLVKRWRVKIVGDFRSDSVNDALLRVRPGNFPIGSGWHEGVGESETGNLEDWTIEGTASSTWVYGAELLTGWFSPTAVVSVSDFDSVNRTDWDGVHLLAVMFDGDFSGETYDGIIDSVEIEFEVYNRGFIQQEFGRSLPAILGRLGYESGAQILPVETSSGPAFKWSYAERTAAGVFSWTVNGNPITEWQESIEHTRDLLTILSRYRFFTMPNRSLLSVTGSPEELYRSVIQCDPKVSDLSAFVSGDFEDIEEATGNVEANSQFLLSTYDALSDYVAEYIVAESIRYPAAEVKLIGVPWSQAYDRVVGDVCMVQLEDWSSARKMRIIGLEKHFTGGTISVACVEVN